MNTQIFKPIGFFISLASLLVLLWNNVSLLMGKSAPVDLSFVKIFFVLFPVWAFTIYYLNQIKTLEGEGLAQMNTFQKIRHFLGVYSAVSDPLIPLRFDPLIPRV